jgi:hypothetical protein
VQCSAVQCRAVQCSAVQCSVVQCSAVQCLLVARTCGADSHVRRGTSDPGCHSKCTRICSDPRNGFVSGPRMDLFVSEKGICFSTGNGVVYPN